MPKNGEARYRTIEWLMWQMGGPGPMFGQVHHFVKYNKGKAPYAEERYLKEAHRLYGVLDKRLAGREYICGAFSIADCASWPWTTAHERLGQKLADFPNLSAWYDRMKSRPGVQRGMDVGRELRTPGTMDEAAKKVLFGQTAANVKR